MYKTLIKKSIKDIFDNYEAIVKALIMPVLLLLVLNFVSSSLISTEQKISLGSLFFIFLSIIVDIVILITVHRILILGREAVPRWGIQKFEQREFNFFLKYLIVAVVFVLTVALMSAFLQIIGLNIFVAIFISMLVFSIFLSRISLVFPAIAVDIKMSFRDSFYYTKNFKFLIFITVIIFPVLFSLLFGGVYTLLISFIYASISVNLNFLFVLLNVVVSVFLVSALSNTYIYISETLASQNSNDYDLSEEDLDDKN